MRFLLVDKILEIKKGEYIRGTKVVSFEEGFLKRPCSKAGFLPRTLLMEALAQMASWLVIYSTDFVYEPVLASVERVVISADARTGSRIDIACVVTGLNEEGVMFNASGRVEDSLLIEVSGCKAFFYPLEKTRNVERTRSAFSSLAKDVLFL